MSTQRQKATYSDSEWCTRREAAEMMRVSVSTIDRWAARGILARYDTPSGRSRFARADLLGLRQREASEDS